MNKIMLDMLVSLLESLDQVVKEEARLILRTLKDLFIKLGSDYGDTWFDELKKFLRKEQCWTLTVFTPKNKFVVNTEPNAPVKISGLGTNFKNWMPSMLASRVGASTLTSFVLDTTMSDKNIIVRIGGVQKSIVSLEEIYREMEKQPKGPQSRAGSLQTNSLANIFYVPQAVKRVGENRFSYQNLVGTTIEEDLTDAQYLFKIGRKWFVLRAVYVHWGVVGWFVNARSVEDPDGWGGGRQVFSRLPAGKASNSVLGPSENSDSASSSLTATTD